MKDKLWIYLLNFCKIVDGQKLPKYMILIRVIIYPINTLWHWMARKHDVFDMYTNRYKIYGKYYSDIMFRGFSNKGFPVETKFKFVCKDGETLTIEEVD